MGKIRSCIFRYRVYCFIVSVLMLIGVYFTGSDKIWSLILILIVLSYVLPMYTYYLENSKKLKGVYFSKGGIIVYDKNKQVAQLEWDEIQVNDLKTFRIKNSLVIQLSSIKEPSKVIKIPITWFVEKSVLEITKKYVPRSHGFYKRIEQYANERKLKY